MAFNNIPINGFPKIDAENIPFADDDFDATNVKDAIVEASSGGGGGTTVVANPEGSATANLSKLQVGTTIYGIPAEAGDISYDNTSSGMTADDVQEAIDELDTIIGGITELIPSDATSLNKLATAADIPGTATTQTAGIVQPDGTTITINNGVISASGGSGSGETYSETETEIGTWLDAPLYRKVVVYPLTSGTSSVDVNFSLSNVTVKRYEGYIVRSNENILKPLPYVSADNQYNFALYLNNYDSAPVMHIIAIGSTLSTGTVITGIIEYTKNS